MARTEARHKGLRVHGRSDLGGPHTWLCRYSWSTHSSFPLGVSPSNVEGGLKGQRGLKETHREKRRGRREEQKELAAQDVEHEE